jgi:hypothetical protein
METLCVLKGGDIDLFIYGCWGDDLFKDIDK